MREAPLRRVKEGYTTGARQLASKSIVGLARTRVTPNALTVAGVSLCLAAAVLVYFENRDELLFYWLGPLFVGREVGRRLAERGGGGRVPVGREPSRRVEVQGGVRRSALPGR